MPFGKGAARLSQIELDNAVEFLRLCVILSEKFCNFSAFCSEEVPMSKLCWMVVLAALSAAPAAAQTAVPDVRGVWKGESESIVLGHGNAHHDAPVTDKPRLSTIAFTMTIDMQDGRRFSGTFASPRSTDTIVAVISHTGTIYMVDDDGWTSGTMLAPNRMELCYMARTASDRVASCTVMTKQP
jgi:hypothetical protein